METELRKLYQQYLKERDDSIVGEKTMYCHGKFFSSKNAIVRLKERFPNMKNFEGLHPQCVQLKVRGLGLKKQ